jgi:hypothetical protein
LHQSTFKIQFARTHAISSASATTVHLAARVPQGVAALCD